MNVEHSAQHATATVVVARTARAGEDETARRWIEALVERARRADGHLRSEIQPPGPQHPDEWVVVYEFADSVALDAWLASADRATYTATEADIFVGRPNEQRLATTDHRDSVTAVASFTLLPDRERDFALAYRDLVGALEQIDGFIRCDLFPAVPGAQDETIIVFSFRTREQLDAWLDSDARRAILERIDPMLATERTVNVVAGFAGWFSNDHASPVPTWKQASLVLLALYPTSLALGALRDWLLPDVASPLGVLFGNALGVAVLSWLLMPYLTRRFARWLHR